MIDDGDSDFFFMLGSISKHPIAIAILFAIGIAIAIIAAANQDECEAKECPAGMSAKLLDHECVCVMVLKP